MSAATTTRPAMHHRAIVDAATAADLKAGTQALHLRQVKAIKAAQRQLGMDDDTYRAMLEAQTRRPGQPGKRSAADLDVREGALVLNYLRRMGATNPAAPDAGKRRTTPSSDRAHLMAKVHALLGELGRVTGQPHGLPYADAICKRNGWADAVDFCTPPVLHRLVGALARTLRHRQAASLAVTEPAPLQAPEQR
ncbi:MAG: hypothetical protein RLY71_458 [Pseudomonadota bacterium]|jgi:phage gp16-like protein